MSSIQKETEVFLDNVRSLEAREIENIFEIILTSFLVPSISSKIFPFNVHF